MKNTSQNQKFTQNQKLVVLNAVFNMLDKALQWRNALVVFCLVAALATVAKLGLALAGNERDAYNNVLIFRASFIHLWEGSNPYVAYPSDHNDLFKYSPTFALLAAPMAAMPALVAAALWNVLNSAVFLLGVKRLTVSDRNKAVLLWIALVEATTSLQNFQSNLLIAGLFLFTYIALEQRQWVQAALWTVVSAVIKLYGAVAIVLCVSLLMSAIHQRETQSRQAVAALGSWLLCWLALFGVAPSVIVGWQGLTVLYQQWFELLRADHTISVGMSFFGFVALWMPAVAEPSWKLGVLAVQVLTFVISCLPLARRSAISSPMLRQLVASSLLLWMVVFNHKAESPTYCIALLGVGLWYIAGHGIASHGIAGYGDAYSGDMPWQRYKRYALWLVIALTSVSVTDVVPLWIREQWIAAWNIKALPCTVLWFVLQWQVWQGQNADSDAN